LHTRSPQYDGGPPQSFGQFADVSPLEHTPSPHAFLQSLGHEDGVSPPSQMPLPHPPVLQSPGQEDIVSPLSHLPLPQMGFIRQSAGHVDAVSFPSQAPLPQVAGQSFGQMEAFSSVEQMLSPHLQSSLQLCVFSSGEHL